MKVDEWKPILGFVGFYEVSNTGKVRSVSRLIVDGNRTRKYVGRELKCLPTNSSGHLNVGLYRNGLAKRQLVHRLVAEAFLDNPDNLPVVDHKDGDPSNNHVDNLRWVSYGTNNNNTPYIRYLQSLLTENKIEYMSDVKYGS